MDSCNELQWAFFEHPHLGYSLNNDFFETLPIGKQVIKEMLQCKIEFCLTIWQKKFTSFIAGPRETII